MGRYIPTQTRVHSWKIWERGRAPSFALEIVSEDWEKDYVDAPARCDEAGIEELVVFDPSWAERPGGVGARWQEFRRAPDGGLPEIERHDRDRVRCESLDAWLRVVGFGGLARIRVGTGDDGEDLFPTEAEAERAEKEAALARLRALEAELAKRGD